MKRIRRIVLPAAPSGGGVLSVRMARDAEILSAMSLYVADEYACGSTNGAWRIILHVCEDPDRLVATRNLDLCLNESPAPTFGRFVAAVQSLTDIVHIFDMGESA